MPVAGFSLMPPCGEDAHDDASQGGERRYDGCNSGRLGNIGDRKKSNSCTVCHVIRSQGQKCLAQSTTYESKTVDCKENNVGCMWGAEEAFTHDK